jgi:hypothetical protein
VAKLRSALRAAEAQNEKLAAANEGLEVFAHVLCHELRAPVRQMAGFARSLGEDFGAEFSPGAQQCLHRILEGAGRMEEVVQALFDLSRLGEQPPVRQSVCLNELVREVFGLLEPEAQGRQISWEIDLLPRARCDRSLMKVVFANLLGNALKFTRPRERALIQVGRRSCEGRTVVFVRDNGVGFPAAHAHKLFAPFQRLHGRDQFEGTGMGLALVRRIIQNHGGQVWAVSQEGQGATFSFTLSPECECPSGSDE